MGQRAGTEVSKCFVKCTALEKTAKDLHIQNEVTGHHDNTWNNCQMLNIMQWQE